LCGALGRWAPHGFLQEARRMLRRYFFDDMAFVRLLMKAMSRR
jgi:hypothetical protein